MMHYIELYLLLYLLFDRCHALNFHPSKTHKKTLKRVNKFLSKGEMPVERCDEGHEGERASECHLLNHLAAGGDQS